MQIQIRNEFLLINIMVGLLIVTIFLPPSILRSFLSIPFFLFFPGYCLQAILAPEKGALKLLERVAISVGLSIIGFVMVGFLLNFTPWGITLNSSLFSYSTLIFILSALAWNRRKRLPEEKRFDITFSIKLWQRGSSLDNALTVFLILSTLFAITSMGYTTLFPKVGEEFTEFYILGVGGMAVEYPREMRVGSTVNATVGIINLEGKPMSYRLEAIIEGVRVCEVDQIALNNQEKWERKVSFIVPDVSPHRGLHPVQGIKKVVFFLYRFGEIEPYRSVYYWARVWGRREKFTEFYLSHYPEKMVANRPVNIKLIVVNHEFETVRYQVNLCIIDTKVLTNETYSVQTIELANEEKWEGEVSWIFPEGFNWMISLDLYKLPENRKIYKRIVWTGIDIYG